MATTLLVVSRPRAGAATARTTRDPTEAAAVVLEAIQRRLVRLEAGPRAGSAILRTALAAGAHHAAPDDWDGTVMTDGILVEHGVVVVGLTPRAIRNRPEAVRSREWSGRSSTPGGDPARTSSRCR